MAWVTVVLGLSPAPSSAADTFKMFLAEAGVYATTFEDLTRAGLAGEVPTTSLAMRHLGAAHRIWVEDGGDGRFGPGDRVEWIGDHLAGERSYYNEDTLLNVYLLDVGVAGGARMRARPALAHARPRRHLLQTTKHLEEDRLLLRFRPIRGRVPELWYWQRITYVDQSPTRIPLDLADYHRRSDRPLSLTIEFRGWSTAGHIPRARSLSDNNSVVPEATGLPDHQVEILFNGKLLKTVEWSGQEAFRVEIPDLPKELIRRRNDRIEIRIPVRRHKPEADPVVDVIMLNWLELEYPRKTLIDSGQQQVVLRDAEAGDEINLITDENQPLLVFGSNGDRVRTSPAKTRSGDRLRHGFRLAGDETEFWVTREDEFKAPIEIVRDRPSSLRTKNHRADYLLITHPRLRASLEPLAEMHRKRGLEVEIVEVDNIYDEFSYGVLSPQAIRDFVSWAYHEWRKPAPRFVLLAGDASWDSKHTQPDDALYVDKTYRPRDAFKLSKNQSTSYDETVFRNLIPTWDFSSSEGHAASDNYFVAVDGEDFKPDLAIGRLPVVDAVAAAAVVAKIRRYVEQPEIGPWRRRVLWITNEAKHYQNHSDRFAKMLGERGYSSTKVYPSSREKTNAEHQVNLRKAFDKGNVLVHFVGHGGRYIWRTGPPDLEKNHDLFTLEDLERLAPTDRLALVLSMTCYSAPFDHPTADSIGEKFLRLPERGAIGVFAASWRNNPPMKFSELLLEAVIREETFGEAIRVVKNEIGNRELVGTYNLLGDPAIPIPRPELAVEVAVQASGAQPRISIEVPAADFRGRALIDWVDDAGNVVASDETVVSAARLEVSYGGETGGVTGARVYVWNAEEGIDGLGAVSWSTEEAQDAAPASGAR